jgi:sigma-B regulation protein RsbU (phosphoserine phosphatase)
MDQPEMEKFRSALVTHRDELLEWLSEKEYKKRIHLGSAQVKDVLEVLSEMKETLEKLDTGEFGKCEACDGSVENDRLEMDYTKCVCIDHLTEKEVRSLEQDLELAGKVQRQLLATCTPTLPEMEISVFSKPAQIVGGDYYDFFGFEDGSQGITIADVMGKGLSASMLMSNLQASLRIIGPEYDDPKQIASRLNHLFLHNLKLIRFISIFMGIINPKDYTIRYCNAGHHPPILFKSDNREIKLLMPTGPAIGLSREPEYTSETIKLSSGDLLLLYTDGLLESRSRRSEEFGEKRLIEYVKQHNRDKADKIISGIMEYVKSFSDYMTDDITMMVLKREAD